MARDAKFSGVRIVAATHAVQNCNFDMVDYIRENGGLIVYENLLIRAAEDDVQTMIMSFMRWY